MKAEEPHPLHLLVDFFGSSASTLCDQALIERLLLEGARCAGATILQCHVHSFGSGEGVTGVALLAESHLSIHTWPELGFAAADIFMCGDSQPRLALEVLDRGLQATHRELRTISRGVSPGGQPLSACRAAILR